ncbi:dihydrolipoyl dehydrogenase [bacterium]|nr:dihydrolipoyl dehydrogenase [bacterium]
MQRHDLVIIGAGPGGYVAALRAAQLGIEVACVEKEPALGGTCLRVGCVPSKALLESSLYFARAKAGLAEHGVQLGRVSLDLAAMMTRKDAVVKGLTDGIAELFKRRGVTRYAGAARFTAPGGLLVTGDDGEQRLVAQRAIIATGSRAGALPGVELDGDRIGTSTEALAWSEVPGELVVIGAGAIGLELGSVWSRLGAKVTVLEYLDRVLPGMDLEIARETQRLLKKQGLAFKLSARVTGARLVKGRPEVALEGGETIRCDRVLLATGRVPNTEGLGLAAIGLATDERGRIPVGAHFATGVPGVFAIGDVIAGPMLAHKAEEEGIACVEAMAGRAAHLNYDTIPGVVYTHPEAAGVGKTEEDLKGAGTPYKKGVFHFRANSRARAIAEIDGRVKVLAHGETDRVLGVHIVGPLAGELIAEAAVAMAFGASAEDIARACHAHPTLAEAIKEAALAVDERAIHA